MIDLQKHDGVYVLHMNAGENRFNAGSLDALDAALDRVEGDSESATLVTIGTGKFYSNGLDLEWMSTAGPEQARVCVDRVHALLGRMLTFPAITIAALNGHAFAAGAMLALAHDLRVMRADRGYFCMPEVDLRLPFTEPMNALIKARLPRTTAHEAMVTGRRYTAEQAFAAGIVQQTAAEAEVLPAAIGLAKTHAGKHGPTIAAIKRTAYRDVLAAIAAAAAERAPGP